MKTLTLFILLASSGAYARDTYVHSYVRHDGTYVEGHHRTTQDNTVNNNYGTQGNTNPYSGEDGKKARKAEQPQGEYNPGNGQGTVYGDQ